MKRKLKCDKWQIIGIGTGTLFLAATLLTGWFYGTEQGSRVRFLMADSLLTTRHADWAWLFIGKKGMAERRLQYEKQFDRMAAAGKVPALPLIADRNSTPHGGPIPTGVPSPSSVPVPSRVQPSSNVTAPSSVPAGELFEVREIKGKSYKGFLLYVSDPLKLRIGVPAQSGSGEVLSSMVQRTGALAGVNGGAFADPQHMGDGSEPIGIVISGGELIFNSEADDVPLHLVGIDGEGRLVAGKYTPSEAIALGIREAVTFAPRFIADGKGLIKDSRDGWGIAPRTAIGQLEDGTIVFAVIDGRQLHSIGASLYDLQQLYLELGAVTAANLDGGASTELVVGKQILNKPATRLGERPLPTAWLLFESPDTVRLGNPWEEN